MAKLTLDEYQQAALRTANQDRLNEVFHLTLGLSGEAGEIAEKIKKIVRDEQSDFSKLDLENLNKELGDVLWHIAVLADYFDIKLEDVAKNNIEKLADRQRRGKLSGSGDNR